MTADAPPRAAIRARLYDADGRDREIALKDGLARGIAERQLLWIDLQGRAPDDIKTVAAAVGMDPRLVRHLEGETGRADLTQYKDHIHLVLEAMDVPRDGTGKPDNAANGQGNGEAPAPERREVDLVAGRNWVATVHSGPVSAIERVMALTSEDRQVGALDAAGFFAAIVDEVLAGYLALAESIEQEIDRLDERALRTKPHDDVLIRVVALRRRIGTIRRALTPHRLAFAALLRPEMELHDELGQPWPALNERLERAIDAVENLRELLIGTFDIHMGRSAQDANEIMKRLTLLSAVLLPAVVLAGIMGMNFAMEFFKNTANFYLVVVAMIAFGVTLLVGARWRGWL